MKGNRAPKLTYDLKIRDFVQKGQRVGDQDQSDSVSSESESVTDGVSALPALAVAECGFAHSPAFSCSRRKSIGRLIQLPCAPIRVRCHFSNATSEMPLAMPGALSAHPVSKSHFPHCSQLVRAWGLFTVHGSVPWTTDHGPWTMRHGM
jgi:hypothetical protein